MRIIVKFSKQAPVRFVSHLDIQRLFQRAFRRANIPLAYSQGFNPHPLLSFATALSVGYTSDGEWLDVKLAEHMRAEAFQEAVNAVLPRGFRISECVEVDDAFPSLSALMAAAEYDVVLGLPEELLNARLQALLASPIMVKKKTKAGIRTVDIRPQLLDAKYEAPTLRILGKLDAAGSLNIALFLQALLQDDVEQNAFLAHRRCIYSFDGRIMPAMSERLQ